MAGRSWKQGAREELTTELKNLLANAADDIRHKVIEQAWSGQEQTGYLLSPYGSQHGDQKPQVNIYTTIHNHQASSDAEQQEASPYVHVPAGDWTEGEDYRGGYGGSGNDDRRPRNGWELGQDPTEQPTPQEQERERQEEQEREQGM